MLYLLKLFSSYRKQVGTVVNVAVAGLLLKWLCYFINGSSFITKSDLGRFPTNVPELDDNLLFAPLATIILTLVLLLIFKVTGSRQPLLGGNNFKKYLKEIGVRVGLAYGLFMVFKYPVRKHVWEKLVDFTPSDFILSQVVLTTVWMCICFNTEQAGLWKAVHFIGFVMVVYSIYTTFWTAFLF